MIPFVNAYRALPGAVRGGLLIAFSTLTLSCMQGSVRYVASTGMHPFEIGFFRLLFGGLIFLPVIWRHGWAPFHTRNLGLHALRASVQTVSMLSFFFALTITPFAKAIALEFTGPLFAAIVAMVILGEKLRMRRIGALVFGYLGVLVVIRPGFIEIDAGVMLVMLSALSWGTVMVIVKLAGRGDNSITITLYMVTFSTPICFLAALTVWTTPTLVQLAWLVMIGVLGSLGHLAIAQALREAEMTAIIPFDFLRMIWVSLIGYLAFAEIPDIWTWIGAIMIFSAATYISYRESRQRAKEKA